jgi:hypothetical protein
MHDIIITPEGTSKLLKNLNPTKAISPDKISLINYDCLGGSLCKKQLYVLGLN